MRRKSFFAQLLEATARVAPTGDLVQEVATANRASRPASQLLAAIARTTPAFKPAPMVSSPLVCPRAVCSFLPLLVTPRRSAR